jgi:hypothetical protein
VPGRGQKVADGYLELHVDDSAVRVEIRRQGAAAGTKFTEEFNAQIKKLTGKEIKLDADPKEALKSIAEVETALKIVARESPTVKIHIEAETALKDLAAFRKRFDSDMVKDVEATGGDVAERFLRGFGENLSQLARGGVAPQLAAIIGAGAVLAAPMIAGTIAAAVTGGAATGGIIGGIFLAAKDPEIETYAKSIGSRLKGALTDSALTAFRTPILNALAQIDAASEGVSQKIARVFAATAPSLDSLISTLVKVGDAFLNALVYTAERSQAPMQHLGMLITTVMGSVDKMLMSMADHPKGASQALDDLGKTLSTVIGIVSGFIEGLTILREGFGKIDDAIDKTRYWLEDHARFLDLTADGYKKGSEAAELYRKGVIGAAGSGYDYNAYLAEAAKKQVEYNAKLADTTIYVTNVKDAQKLLGDQQKALTTQLDALGGKMSLAGMTATAMKTAIDNLYGATINAVEANETWEASWDNLTSAVTTNGKSLDVHSDKGRKNRDVLEALLEATNNAYIADIAAGTAIDAARKKHDARIKSIQREAAELGFNKKQTQELIDTYGQIPKNRTTNLLVTGVKDVYDRMTDLYVLQRLLGQGVPATPGNIAAEKAAINGKIGPDTWHGGYAEGGEIEGPGTGTSDSVVIRASHGEFMQRRAAVDYYGVSAMEDLNAKRIPRSALRGYANGGLVFPVDRSRQWPFRVTAAHTRVMSKEDALSKVAPPGPTGTGPTDRFIISAARALVGAIRVISTFRPGARTLSGNRSYHSVHRAVDFEDGAIGRRLAASWNGRYLARTKELISPWNEYGINNGRHHNYTGAILAQHSGSNAHVHIAMDDGGQIMPGWNSIYNGTGRPETATPAPMMDAVVQRLDALINVNEMGLPRGDILELADAIGTVIAKALTGTVPAARAAARQIGKRPR